MKLTVSKDTNVIKESGTSAFINHSGIYDVQLNYVQITKTKNGATQLNVNVTHNGMAQTIYGPILLSKDGRLNEITYKLLNRLCIIAGMSDEQEIETETMEFPVGKDQKLTEMEVIPELCDIPIKIRIQMEYSLWNDEIQERKAIKAFYREDGATASEAESGEDIGKCLARDEEKYASNITYKDGLTEEKVQEWIKERNNSANTKKTPKATTPSKRPLFGK